MGSNPADDLREDLRGVVREVIQEMAAMARQPSIVVSESGIASLKLNQLASGKTQPELKLYASDRNADPYQFVTDTFFIWDQIVSHTWDHEPGKPFNLIVQRPS